MDSLTLTLAVLSGLFVIAFVIAIVSKPKVVILEDEAPSKGKSTSKVMKLQNELEPYIKEEDGKVKIKVVEW